MVLKFPKNIGLKSHLNTCEMQFNWNNNYQTTHKYSSAHPKPSQYNNFLEIKWTVFKQKEPPGEFYKKD